MENILLNKSKKSEKSKVCTAIINVVKMKAIKSIVLLLALNKLRKRKTLFCRKTKNLLLTFALFMQKQDYCYCFNVFSGPFSFTAVLILIQIRCCFEFVSHKNVPSIR